MVCFIVLALGGSSEKLEGNPTPTVEHKSFDLTLVRLVVGRPKLYLYYAINIVNYQKLDTSTILKSLNLVSCISP